MGNYPILSQYIFEINFIFEIIMHRREAIFVIKPIYSENPRRDKVSAFNFQSTFQFKSYCNYKIVNGFTAKLTAG